MSKYSVFLSVKTKRTSSNPSGHDRISKLHSEVSNWRDIIAEYRKMAEQLGIISDYDETYVAFIINRKKYMIAAGK